MPNRIRFPLQQNLSHLERYIRCNDRLQFAQPSPLLGAETSVSWLAVLQALLVSDLALSRPPVQLT